jgi:uncharacterized protein (TIGR02246 family)
MLTSTATSTVSTDESAVLDVIHSVYAAWANNDADAFARLYTEDATVLQPGGVYKKSQDDVRTSMALAFAGPLKGSTVIDEPMSVRLLSGDAAIVISEGGVVMAGEAAPPDDRVVRATWVLTRQSGTWLVAAYHNCRLR